MYQGLSAALSASIGVSTTSGQSGFHRSFDRRHLQAPPEFDRRFDLGLLGCLLGVYVREDSPYENSHTRALVHVRALSELSIYLF